MSLPPLPVSFPPGYWLVRWIAGIHRKNEKSRTVSTLVLIIAPIKGYRHNMTVDQLWRNDAVNLTAQIAFEIPLTYLAAAPVGTVGMGHNLIAPRHRIESRSNINTFDISINVPETQEFADISSPNPRGDRYVIANSIHNFGNQFHNLKNTRCLIIHDKMKKKQIIIPVFELLRFYWGTSSSSFVHKLIDGTMVRFNEKEDFSAFVDPRYTGLDEYGTFHCALRPGLSDTDVYAIGRLWLNREARQNADNMLSGFRLPQERCSGLATTTGFPFAGHTSLKVEGINTEYSDKTSTLLVYRIRRCTHNFPFERLHIFKPQSTSEDQSSAFVGGQQDSENFIFVGEAGVGRRSQPSTTSLEVPRDSRPIMYESEALTDLFPDVAIKAPVYSKGRGGRAVTTRPPGEETVQPGGYGPGVPEGVGTPVGTEPEEDQERTPPRFVDDLAREEKPPLQHLETLDRAVALLRRQGYTVTACCCAHPDEWFALDSTDKAHISYRPGVVYDAALNIRRSRRGKIYEISKPHQNPVDDQVESFYSYVIDLELEGSAFVYFECEDRKIIPENVLNTVIQICNNNGGVWRRRIPATINGKQKLVYYSNLRIPEIRAHITEHRWKDDENKLIKHITKLYQEEWEGMKT